MRRVAMGFVLCLAIGATVVGCGSSPPSGAAPGSTAAGAPTTEAAGIVPDAAVTAGLAEVREHATGVGAALAAGDVDGAKAHAKQMQESWYRFEATVRKNAKDLYLRMEDALKDIQAGARDNRADRLEQGTKDLEEAAAAYRAQHP